MTAKPAWTDEEKFWRSIRQAILGLVDAIEMYRLSRHIDTRTSEVRKRLRSYQRTHMLYPPITAEDARERIVELIAKQAQTEAEEVLTTGPECDKL